MVDAAQSGPLALPHSHTGDKRSWAMPFEYDNSNRHRMPGAADTPARLAHHAEIAQARLFEKILQAEFAHLNELAFSMAGPLERSNHPALDGREPSRALMQIHARIDEVHRLLAALRGRFPHGYSDSERHTE